MTYTKEQRHAKFIVLSETIKDLMSSEETADAVGRIARKYRLADEQTPKLAREVGTVLLGLIPKEKLAEQLTAEVGLTQEQARAVAGDIEREIFNNTNYEQGTKIRTEEEKKPEQNPPPIPPPLIKEGEKGGGFNQARPVPIRKIAPPPLNLPTVPLPNLQTLLADIRRGTAFDEARIADAYRKTPIEIRQSLESIGFLSRLQGVARKFGLNVEETGELVSETGLVLLGLTKPPQFIDNLAKRLRLPRDRAFAVGQAVNMEVLRPVREIIRKMNDSTNYEQETKIRTEEKQNTNEGFKFAPSVPQNPPPTLPKYTSDPYREPLE